MIDLCDSRLLAKLKTTRRMRSLSIAARHALVQQFLSVGRIAAMRSEDKRIIEQAKAEFIQKGGTLPRPPEGRDRRREE